jgi:hypothetical protein
MLSRFIRFFKKLFIPPQLTHEAAQEAKRRREISKGITDDEIWTATVRNALNVPDATLTDKLTFAFTSLPDVTTNFDYTKNIFLDILEFLVTNEEVTTEEANALKSTLENIGSFEELMMAT